MPLHAQNLVAVIDFHPVYLRQALEMEGGTTIKQSFPFDGEAFLTHLRKRVKSTFCMPFLFLVSQETDGIVQV